MNWESETAPEIILTTTEPELSETWSLVLTAVQIPHRVVYEDGSYLLFVPARLKERALYELDTYFAENRDWPPREDLDSDTATGIQPPTLLLVGALVLFYGVTKHRSTEHRAQGSDQANVLNSKGYLKERRCFHGLKDIFGYQKEYYKALEAL